MQAYQERVIEEKQQLDEKIEKLQTFVGTEAMSTVSAVQGSLLRSQLSVMEAYSTILGERIKEW